jgi:hypothetical protein
LLLQDKPGCYLENVGKELESCEAELKNFVENSPYCPQLLKDDFAESQITTKKRPETETTVGGNALDELYIEPETNPENVQRDEWMECFAHNNEIGITGAVAEGDEGSDYDEVGPCNTLEIIDWQKDARDLNMTTEKIKSCDKWVDLRIKDTIFTETRTEQFDPTKLNHKQKLTYDLVIKWINDKVKDPKTEPLYLNISGRAGCGKSFFLNCLSQHIKGSIGKNFLKIAAPTGTAAFIIKGTTLHSLLKLPLHVSYDKDIPEMYADPLRELQREFEGVELLVIDEKSMVGLHMLYMIHKRLTEIKPRNASQSFGGVSIIIMGDFAQLPPVTDLPLYADKAEKMHHYQVFGSNLFQLFEKTIIFNEIMRQQGDDQKQFRECLDKLSDGTFKSDDWKYLQLRDLYGCNDDGPNFSVDQREDFLNTAVMLCSRNVDLKNYNIRRIKALGTPIAAVKSQNNHPEAASAKSNDAQGLLSQILIAKNCQVLLTTNAWKQAGLTNGTRGEIRYIIYEKGKKPPSLPSVVIVHFPQYLGPSYLPQEEKCVPIVPMTRTWPKRGKILQRTMLPLIPAYAITIYKSQGMSLDKIIVDIGKKEFANGLTYTAISRCPKIENLAFYPFMNFRRFTSVFTHNIFKSRKRQDERERKSDEQITGNW